jgi:hypothetical protein
MGFTARSKWGVVWAVVLYGSVCAEAGRAAAQVRVLVFINNNARIPTEVVDRAGTEVVRIFRAAGIELEWVNCSSENPIRKCRVVFGGKELVLHVVPRGTTSNDSVYGEAFVGGDGRGKYIDVFWDQIGEAHRDRGFNVAELFGAVAAHEIGHLLLGLHAHSWIGIMAPVWDEETLKHVGMGDLRFSREQALQMRERMRSDQMNVASLE